MNTKKFMLILGVIGIAVGSFVIRSKFELQWGLISPVFCFLLGSLSVRSWCKPDESESPKPFLVSDYQTPSRPITPTPLTKDGLTYYEAWEKAYRS